MAEQRRPFNSTQLLNARPRAGRQQGAIWHSNQPSSHLPIYPFRYKQQLDSTAQQLDLRDCYLYFICTLLYYDSNISLLLPDVLDGLWAQSQLSTMIGDYFRRRWVYICPEQGLCVPVQQSRVPRRPTSVLPNYQQTTKHLKYQQPVKLSGRENATKSVTKKNVRSIQVLTWN